MVGALCARSARALPLPANVGRSGASAQELLPAPIAADYMTTLASAAVDAAKTAGATYADVRLGEQHLLDVSQGNSGNPGVGLETLFTFGVRVLVNGAWAFTHGTVPSAEAVTVAAKNAVATARGYARVTPTRVEVAAESVATGTWSVPVEIDPFAVPLRDQTALLDAYASAAARVRHAGTNLYMRWIRETRVFASTEGALTIQHFRRGRPWFSCGASWGEYNFGGAFVRLQGDAIGFGSGGYELVARTGIQERIKAIAETTAHVARLPQTTLDIGRYPVVFGGPAVGTLAALTLGPALELDRALGYEADASGTSYLSPAVNVIGTQVASPLLSITAHRNLPSMNAVQWDDEGVAVRPFPLITDGRVVDYLTSRQTAPALRAVYAKQGLAIRSNGCALAPQAGDPVMVWAPHLDVAPGKTSASVDDLCRGMSKGLLITDALMLDTDHQLASGSLITGNNVMAFEVQKGKIVRRVRGNMLQFGTGQLWRSLVTLGDETTMRNGDNYPRKGQPWREITQTVSAPAALFKDMNISSANGRV
jgi:TldD protein